jgi:hypothetical protein
MVNSVADLIELWPSAEAFSADIGLKWPGHGRVMKLRSRIPREHWPRVVAAAAVRDLPVTEDLLQRLHQRQPQAVAS